MGEASQQCIDSNRSSDPGLASSWGDLGASPGMPGWAEFGRITQPFRSGHPSIEGAVQRDIVPHLRNPRYEGAASPVVSSLADGVETLGRLVLARDLPQATAYVDFISARGMAAERLYLELLAPTARHLGDLWTEDMIDFGQVAIGLGNLHRLLRDLSPVFQAKATGNQAQRMLPADRSGLLVAAPGERHTFGLAMVTALFRHAGWAIWSGAPNTAAELNSIVRGQFFGVVGFSLAYEGRLDALRTSIRTVRRISRNPCIRILVGGPVFIEHPEFVAQVGADAMAVDGQQAVMQAESLLTRLPPRV